MSVCVIGAGVIGLSSAVCIANQLQSGNKGIREDNNITLISDKFSPNTTSDGAAGLIRPVMESADSLGNQTRQWSKSTYEWCKELYYSAIAEEVGVSFMRGCLLYEECIEDEPEWKSDVIGFTRVSQEELQQFNASGGWSFVTPTLCCANYLPWLLNKFQMLGGHVIQRRIHSISELYDDFQVIVNCTGLGAQQLVKDDKLIPIRGQVRRVHAPWVRQFLMNYTKQTSSYIIPSGKDVVLGKTYQVNSWDTSIDPSDTAAFTAECFKLIPGLKSAQVVNDWCGLRPARTTVRIAAEEINISQNTSVRLIHNYGHSGYGVALHWGCAQEVCLLAANALGIEYHDASYAHLLH